MKILERGLLAGVPGLSVSVKWPAAQAWESKSRKFMKGITMATTRRQRMAARCAVYVFSAVLTVFAALRGQSAFAQTPPTLPASLNRFAAFGCDSLSVSGNVKIYGVSSVGGVQGLGGNIASNGNIVVDGTNTIAGNATPGPGGSVKITGDQSQIQGSQTPAASVLRCEESSLSAWASYAQGNNNNASIPSKFLDSSRNLTLGGSKTCTLTAGIYYVNNVTCTGGAKLVLSGSAVFVVTGTLSITGSNDINKGGDPKNLMLILVSSAPVTLAGSAKVSMKVYAPLSAANLDGTLQGNGNLWGKSLSANGNVTWNRVKGSATPTIAIMQPADGSTVTQPRPQLAFAYQEDAAGPGVNPASFRVTLDGTNVTASLTVTATGATGQAPTGLAAGSHALAASISDFDSNSAQAQSTFTVSSGGDTTPPVITISGVADGAWYNHDVAATISMTDDNLDPASVQITLNGQPYISGAAISTEGYFVLAVSASDTFGNAAQAALAFAIDKTPPQVTVSSPPDNGLTNASPATLTGYVMDAHPDTLTVNGTVVGSPGQSSFSAPVALVSGANTITFVATDRAGNSSTLPWHVTLKTTPPTVAITVPGAGLVTRSTAVDVSGTVSAETISVDVNGKLSAVSNGSFRTPQVPLVEGANVLTATAKDGAGNTAAATVSITKDSQPPAIVFTLPADNSHTSASSVPVTGRITDASAVTATINGTSLPLSAGAFSTSASLVQGTNLIEVSATDAAGNTAQASRTVVLDLGSLQVTSITPTNGSQGVSSTSSIQVSFTRQVNKATVTSATFQVSAGTQSVTGAFVGEGNQIVFLPSAPFPDGATVAVSLTAGIQDQAGNALTPFTASFTVLAGTGGPTGVTLSLDPYPSLTKNPSITLTGRASAGATVTITGGASPVTAIAGGDGAFSAVLTLTANALNAFSAQAALSGQTSAQVPIVLVQDSMAPSVLDCTLSGSTFIVNFSEAIAEETVTSSTVSLSVSGAAATWTSSLDGSGTRLTVTPTDAIGANPTVLAISAGVTDLAGNALAQPYTKAFQGGSAGDAFLEGEVYDDATGLPLSGVSVALAGGSASTASGPMGAWALPAPSGQATVHLSATGYSDAYRSARVSSGQIEAVLDARLTALSAEQKILPAAGGTATFASGVNVTVPAGAFAADATGTATSLTGQALPAPLPPGFAPLAAWRMDVNETPSAALGLSLPRPAGTSGSLPAALFDASSQQWTGLAATTDAGTGVAVALPASSLSPFTVVLLRLDQSPAAPSTVVEGQPLTGVAPTTLQTATATLTAEPSTILPDQKATATVAITPPSAASSGAPFSVTFTESLDMTDHTTHSFSPYTSDFLAYQDAAVPANLKVIFPVSPFPGIDVLTLLDGKIHLEVGPYNPGTVGGGIVGSGGGTVNGSGGIEAVLPAGAVTNSVPVQVLPVSSGSLLLPVPDNFAYVGGVELRLGGASLGSPAVLSLDAGALAVPVTSSDLVVVVKADTLSGVSVLTTVDLAVLSGGRLATCSGSGYPSSPTGALSTLPWSKVMGEGRYVFLKATASQAFATGKVTEGGLPLQGGLVGRVLTESSQSKAVKGRVRSLVSQGKAPASALEALNLVGITMASDAQGAYVIPLPIGSSTLEAVNLATADTGSAHAAPSQALQVVPQDIAIQAVPIAVASTSPANGAQDIPASSEIYVTFTKLVGPASVTSDHVAVTTGGQSITGTLRVVSGGTIIGFTPNEPLPSGATISVAIQGITDRATIAMDSPYTFSFTVASASVPRLDPGQMVALLPDASGAICVQGGKGSVEGLAIVYLVNTTHYEYGTATVTAATDGSFNVCIQGAAGDRIELHVVVPGAADRVYAFTQLVSADHQSVGMGPDGGTFTSMNSDKTPLATINVMPGTFDGPAIISLKPGDPAQTAPVPNGFFASAPIAITLSAPAKKEIALILPAPQGWNVADTTKAFWLVNTVSVGGANPITSPMVLDTMSAGSCPGAGGSCLATNSPPFPGLITSGQYQVYQVAAGAWGFFSGTFAPAGGDGEMFVSCAASPFVYMMNDTFGFNWVLPVPMQAPSAAKTTAGYTITVTDNSTGEVLVTITRTDPPDPGKPTDLGISTNIPTRPYLMGASPFKALPFQLKAAAIQDSSNPAVSFQILLASHADARVTAPVGSAAAGSGAVVTVTCGGQTAYAPLLPDGSIDFTLGTLHSADLSSAVDLRPSLSSGQTLAISYASATGTGTTQASVTVPSQPVTDKLNLTIAQGSLYLQAQAGFGDNGLLRLYDAMANAAQVALGQPQQASGLNMDLSSYGLSTGDVLFYTLSETGVDPCAALTVTFDARLQSAPAAWKQAANPSGPAVRLVDVASAQPLPIAVSAGGGLRMLTITPGTGLKAGAEYELQLWNLQGFSGNGYPAGQYIAGRFTLEGPADLGSKAFTEVYDIARRGSILYMAVGDQGYDVVDASDPTNPQSMVNGPVAEGGTNRSVAIADNLPVTEGSQSNPRTVIVLAGGGGGDQGTIRLHYADPQDEVPDQPQPIGTFIGGGKLCDAVGSQTGSEGTPTLVRTLGTTAFVSTVGVGLQVVDLTKIQAANTNVVVNAVKTYGTKDISMSVRGVAVMTAPAGQTAIPAFVLSSVQGYGVVAWNASNTAMAPAGEVRFPGCANFAPSGAMRINAYPNYAYTQTRTDGTQAPMTTNLVLMACGSAGLAIFEAVPGNGSLGLTLKAVVPTPGEAYDVAMDTRRGIAYVACYNAGVAEVDLRDPYAHPIPAQGCGDGTKPYGLWDANGDGQDDRITGVLASAAGSRSTIVVDSDTGIVYVGEQGTNAGLKVRGAQQPRMEFVLDDSTHPGQYKVPGYLSAFDGDKPRLALWLPGGAGTQVGGATVQLYDRKGFEETPAQDANGNNVVSTVYRGSVTLARQSAKRTESKFNFYIEAPNEITLGMIYDPANPDPTLMVSKQSGSIKGTATFNGWKGWATNPSITKPVSRPWVEWTKDELEDPDETPTTESLGATTANESDPVVSNYDGPKFIGVLQPRHLTMRYADPLTLSMLNPWDKRYPLTLTFTLQNATEGVITGVSPSPAGAGVTIASRPLLGTSLEIKVKGEQTTTVPEGNKLVITAHYASGETKAIASYPIWVVNAGLAVDYNRDREIHFWNDPEDSSDKKDSDKPVLDSQGKEKPFEFWLNDNFDYQKGAEAGDDGNVKAYQDERQVAYFQKIDPRSGMLYDDTTRPKPDWCNDKIQVERDLEDFSPLHVLKVPPMGKDTSKIQYFLYLKGTSQSPSIKVFRPIMPNPSDAAIMPYPLYLDDPAVAAKQLDATCLGTATAVQYKSNAVPLPNDAFLVSSKQIPFMFEGVAEGDGLCTLELRYQDQRLARYKVPVRLKKVGQFVEEYTVGDDEDQVPAATPLEVHTLPPPGVNDDKNYILWVHGWNWEDWQKKAYGYSTYKRLYWLGYKGTFGIYKWPDTYGNQLHSALTFDDSERHALLSGAGLKTLITQLKGRQFNVHLYAHSQGCMVSSEALRKIALDGSTSKPVVDSLTFSQAAVSARMYDGNYPEYDDWAGLLNNMGLTDLTYLACLVFADTPGFQEVVQSLQKCPIHPQWPDLHGHFPYHLESPGTAETYAPYFQPVQQAVKSGMMFNFYNPLDYPTGQYNTDGGWNHFSGSYLLDQLIKPFRIVSYPLYSNRAYRMVYGAQNLSYQDKIQFARSGSRQDQFCVGSPVLADCGVPTTCSGSPIFDFSTEATKFEMLAYGCSSYSHTLGGHDPNQHLNASSGFLDYTRNEVDLKAVFGYGKYVMWHGAQFRGMLASQKDYWRQFLTNIGTTPR